MLTNRLLIKNKCTLFLQSRQQMTSSFQELHGVKIVQIRRYFWSVFPVFGLNTERYSVSLRIQSEYTKIRNGNNSAFGHFSRSVRKMKLWLIKKYNIMCNMPTLFLLMFPRTIIVNHMYTAVKNVVSNILFW